MNPVKWASAEAKKLKRQFPNRYKGKNAWIKGYMKEAWAIYYKKFGEVKKSSIKPKRTHKKKAAKKIARKKSAPRRKRIGSTAQLKVGAYGKVSGAPMGSLKSEIRKRYQEQINHAVIRKFHAKTKRERAKAQKALTEATAKYKRFS